MSEPIPTPEVTPEPTPEPTPTPPASDFSQSFGGELKGHPGLAKFANQDALGTSYLDLEKTLSSLGTRVPKAGATEEEISKFRTAIGVPETTEGYAFAESLELPEGVEMDAGMIEKLLPVMHKEGLTTLQAKAIGQAYADYQQENIATEVGAATSSKEAAEKFLKGKWGSSYPAKMKGANLALNHLFKDNINNIAATKLADGTYLGNLPAFLEAMAEVGEDYIEHGVHGMAERARLTMTPEEAEAELGKLSGDQAYQDALWNKEHAGHDAAVARRDALYAMKAGGA